MNLYEKLAWYADTDAYPFHMPGHKRRSEIRFEDPYRFDITEIDGFDDLHHPEDILLHEMEFASKLYGTDKSYFLVNGSTCGILTAISAVTELGSTILTASNCHKSVWNAVHMRNLYPVRLSPEYTGIMGINGGILPEKVERILSQNQKIRGVMIVSPTYEGIVSDVRSIAKVCHDHNVPLIVDEAHGAHLNFRIDDYFPESAVACGADIVIQSLHKTLPALTQTAILHVQGNLVDREKVERYLGIYQTSSPSYVLMASIDSCLHEMADHGRDMMEKYERDLREFWRQAEHFELWGQAEHFKFRGQAEHFQGMRFLYQELSGNPELCRRCGIAGIDPGKIVFGRPGWTGPELQEKLREDFHLELEMSALGYALAMTSPCDTEEGYRRLLAALKKISEPQDEISDETRDEIECGKNLRNEMHGESWNREECAANFSQLPEGEQVMTPYEASCRETEDVIMKDAVNHISAEMTYIYPPGIPFFLPGERITEEMCRLIVENRSGNLQIRGLKNDDRIRVVKE